MASHNSQDALLAHEQDVLESYSARASDPGPGYKVRSFKSLSTLSEGVGSRCSSELQKGADQVLLQSLAWSQPFFASCLPTRSRLLMFSVEITVQDENQHRRRHSTPAALMSQEDIKSTGHASVGYESTTTVPYHKSETHCHHIMQQWKEENPREEPFSSVVYYAKKDVRNPETGVIDGGNHQNGK